MQNPFQYGDTKSMSHVPRTVDSGAGDELSTQPNYLKLKCFVFVLQNNPRDLHCKISAFKSLFYERIMIQFTFDIGQR
jgi:hypothetical protein